MKAVFICDSHPVQYKAPIYQRLAEIAPHCFKVIYATDCSVRGHDDSGFGRKVIWDTPLLTGYDGRVCGQENGTPLRGFMSLLGGGVASLIFQEQPAAVIMSSTLYFWDFVVIISCVLLGIPLGLRVETQDEAFFRSSRRSFARQIVWRSVYSFFTWALFIGKLNRDHLLKHGFRERQLVTAPYCVRAEWATVSDSEKMARRIKTRSALGIGPDEICVAFFGKFIPKKQPELLLEMLQFLGDPDRAKLRLMYVGAGILDPELRLRSQALAPGTVFTGFINQSALPDYYWATDIFVLPSRRQGETWGLVVNEALHAGCSVVVTEAVGSHPEFSDLDRVRIIPVGDPEALATAIASLLPYRRDFNWARAVMEKYSVNSAAKGFVEVLDQVSATPALI